MQRKEFLPVYIVEDAFEIEQIFIILAVSLYVCVSPENKNGSCKINHRFILQHTEPDIRTFND